MSIVHRCLQIRSTTLSNPQISSLLPKTWASCRPRRQSSWFRSASLPKKLLDGRSSFEVELSTEHPTILGRGQGQVPNYFYIAKHFIQCSSKHCELVFDQQVRSAGQTVFLWPPLPSMRPPLPSIPPPNPHSDFLFYRSALCGPSMTSAPTELSCASQVAQSGGG